MQTHELLHSPIDLLWSLGHIQAIKLATGRFAILNLRQEEVACRGRFTRSSRNRARAMTGPSGIPANVECGILV